MSRACTSTDTPPGFQEGGGSFADLVADLQPIDGGWRIKETETHYIDVLRMAFNDRIVTTPKGSPFTYDRYWCYDKGGAAMLAALAWDGSPGTEPVGWKKAHGERYPDR